MMPPFDTALLKQVECEHTTIVQAKTELAKSSAALRNRKIRKILTALQRTLGWKQRDLPETNPVKSLSA